MVQLLRKSERKDSRKVLLEVPKQLSTRFIQRRRDLLHPQSVELAVEQRCPFCKLSVRNRDPGFACRLPSLPHGLLVQKQKRIATEEL